MEDQNISNLSGANVKAGASVEKKTRMLNRLPMILCAISLLLCLLVTICACGQKNVEIAIKEDAMPQSVFVLGEELDLSSGVLVVNIDGKPTEIAMNAEGVTVSGFDKNTLGEQKITVTYMEKSVEMTVTVVERMQVVDFTADYLLGDTLDLSKGRLKITRNDGSNYTVTLKSDKVKIEGFSSENAGAKTLTVTYTSGEENYTASFGVNIHNVENVTLTKPTKVTYNSHDEGIDVKGGILTLSALNGQLKKDITVTEDMIEGFDLSAVNDENTPLTQTVNVKYDNKSYPYEIVIRYSAVTKFKSNADIASDFTWSGEDVPEISEEDGELALELMRLYLDMSPAEQVLLTKEETLNMARVAMIYGFNKWGEDIYEFEGAFTLTDGQFELQCTDRESVEAAIELLEDTDRPIYVLYDVLSGMITTFEEETLFTFTEEGYEDVPMYFGEYPTVDPEFFELLIDVFEYMVDLDDLMDAVEDDWFENIEDYADEIEAVYASIVNSEFYSNEFSQFFYYVSMWRPNDDAFDFLYHYYYEVKADVSAIISIANIRLPSALEEIFAHVYEAMNQIDALANYMAVDTTQFFYHYHMACKLSREILTSDLPEDEMNKVLFYGLPLNSMLGITAEEIYTFNDMISYLSTTQGGYYPLCGALLDMPEFDALMEKYLDIIVKTFDDEAYEASADYVTDVKALLALYMELSPSQQFCFLGTLNAFYAMNIPPLAFDNTGEYAELICLFVDMVNDVYTGLFETQEGKDAYLALMLATEAYAQRFTSDTWLETFHANMKIVETALAGNQMSAADKTTFTTELGAIYTDYCSILENYPEGEEEPSGPDPDLDLGEWEDIFAELEAAVLGMEFTYTLIDQGYAMYDLFLSAFERAQELANQILASDDEQIKNIYLHSTLYSLSNLDRLLDPDTEIDPETEVFWSYDYVLSVYRAVYVNLQVSIGGSIYDQYQAYGMSEFMNKMYDLLWSMMWSEQGDTDIFDKEKVVDLMLTFCNMDIEAQMLFVLYIEGEYGIYYETLSEFLTSYSDDVAAAIEQLINVEMSVVLYNYYLNLFESGDLTEEELAEVVAELQDAYAAFEDALDAVDTAAEQTELADFEAIISFYEAVLDGINANA